MKISIPLPVGFHLEPEDAALVIANEIGMPGVRYEAQVAEGGTEACVIVEGAELTAKIVRDKVKILLSHQLENIDSTEDADASIHTIPHAYDQRMKESSAA